MPKFKDIKLSTVLNWIPNIKRIKPVDIKKHSIANGVKYPFYGQQLQNNGVVDYIAVDKRFLNNLNSEVYLLIASNNHSISVVTTPFYIKEDHAATSTIGHPNMSLSSALYIKGSIQKVFDLSFDYNAKALQGILQNTYVKLPFIEGSDKLDWKYMEEYVDSIKQKDITNIKTFLNKYRSCEEYKDGKISSLNECGILNVTSKKYIEKEIGDLFYVRTSKKKFNAQSIVISAKGHPYVARGSLNNGIKGYTFQNEKFLNDGNTISFGQDTATIFYQKQPYFTGDKIKILYPKYDHFNEINAMYIITAMRRSFGNFSWGSSSFDVKILNSVKICLPIDEKGNIDFEYMEKYIYAIKNKVAQKIWNKMSFS